MKQGPEPQSLATDQAGTGYLDPAKRKANVSSKFRLAAASPQFTSEMKCYEISCRPQR
jgi:hypothetical protein